MPASAPDPREPPAQNDPVSFGLQAFTAPDPPEDFPLVAWSACWLLALVVAQERVEGLEEWIRNPFQG
eukprot:7060808-Lingulodinium_polyedra.AAC.1